MGLTSTRRYTLYCAGNILHDSRALNEEDALYQWGMDPALTEVERRAGHRITFRYTPDSKTYVITDMGYD